MAPCGRLGAQEPPSMHTSRSGFALPLRQPDGGGGPRGWSRAFRLPVPGTREPLRRVQHAHTDPPDWTARTPAPGRTAAGSRTPRAPPETTCRPPWQQRAPGPRRPTSARSRSRSLSPTTVEPCSHPLAVGGTPASAGCAVGIAVTSWPNFRYSSRRQEWTSRPFQNVMSGQPSQ